MEGGSFSVGSVAIESIVCQQFSEHVETVRASENLSSSVAVAASLIVEAIRERKHIYSCGNGGSTCDAMHLTEEFVAQYKNRRLGIAAHHLMDPAILTCWSNDEGFVDVFRRQVEAYGRVGDVFIGISTSGNSENVYRALFEAKKKGMKTISFLGKGGGKMKGLADVDILVPSGTTARVQEVHILCIHAVLEVVEREVFDTI